MSLAHVTGQWIPSAPGSGLDEDIRERLLTLGVRACDLDLWERHSTGPDHYRYLAQNLKSCAAWDHNNPTPDGVVPQWPVQMDIDDAMAWLIVACQGADARLRAPGVRHWHEHSPHGWAFTAAGVGLTEALSADRPWDWDALRAMAALRDVVMPDRPVGFEIGQPVAPSGPVRPFKVLVRQP